MTLLAKNLTKFEFPAYFGRASRFGVVRFTREIQTWQVSVWFTRPFLLEKNDEMAPLAISNIMQIFVKFPRE